MIDRGAGYRRQAPAGEAAAKLDDLYVDGLGPLGPLLGVERHLRSIGEGAGAVRKPRLMDEQILAALVGGDEAERFSSLNHLTVPVAMLDCLRVLCW